MYARVTLLEIDPLRASIEGALETFEEAVLPALRERDGYEGTLALATPEGKGLLLTLWSSADAAQAATTFASEQLERHMTLFKAPPGREHYQVVFSDLPALR